MTITSPGLTRPIRLHRHALSGHSHRVQLLLSLLGLEVEFVEVDLEAGAHKSPAYLALNPFGQLPIIEDGELVLADSNAILVYLATRYDASGRWLPRDPVGAARVQRWLSVAAGPLAYGPAAARVCVLFGGREIDARAVKAAARLFGLLEAHLAASPFLAGDHPTIADVALYSYTAHAPEGGASLDGYPALRTWLARIEALDGFVPMRATATVASSAGDLHASR
jgi:glutathione S-transferase